MCDEVNHQEPDDVLSPFDRKSGRCSRLQKAIFLLLAAYVIVT